MLAERPVLSIGALLRQSFSRTLEGFVPSLREHRVNAEEAKKDLDTAYSELGRENGFVTEEQARNVLNAELRVAQASFLPKLQFGYVNEEYLREALEFHTIGGLRNASRFMSLKADEFRRIAYNQRVAELDLRPVLEIQRRANACEKSSDLLTSISTAISHPR